MCGRYVSVSTPEQLAEAFDVAEVRTEPLPPRYNVAPTLDVYSVIEHDGTRRLGTLRWGFVPFWAKQLKGSPSPINARIEGLADSRMFAPAVTSRRCVIPADAFYEWHDRGEGSKKQPYVFRDPDGAPLAFAGLWSSWRDPAQGEEAEPLYSCAIVTVPAAGPVAEIHDRMPAMLPRRLIRAWLGATPDDAPHLLDAVASAGVPRIERYAVSDRVNNVRNEGPELLEPGEVD